MRVTDAEGRTWRVTRRWTPWRRRIRDVVDISPDVSVGSLGSLDGPLALVAAVVVAVLIVPLLVSTALLAAELLLLGLLVPLAAVGRVLLGRRWVVEVRQGFVPRYEELTGGWSDSSRRIAGLAEELRTGAFTVPRDPDDPRRVVRHDPRADPHVGHRPGGGQAW